jgi:hypothetical protein
VILRLHQMIETHMPPLAAERHHLTTASPMSEEFFRCQTGSSETVGCGDGKWMV